MTAHTVESWSAGLKAYTMKLSSKHEHYHHEHWSRHTIPKTQDESLGDSDQIHFTQWQDASVKNDFKKKN